jgi:hypothetical protein
MLPVERLAKATASGALPVSGLGTKLDFGAGTAGF